MTCAVARISLQKAYDSYMGEMREGRHWHLTFEQAFGLLA
jgi:hypothetical protein